LIPFSGLIQKISGLAISGLDIPDSKIAESSKIFSPTKLSNNQINGLANFIEKLADSDLLQQWESCTPPADPLNYLLTV
jgi:hypothetical protein